MNLNRKRTNYKEKNTILTKFKAFRMSSKKCKIG